MSQVPRWRANQFRDFVRMLKLSAVNLNYCIRVAVKSLSRSLDHASLSRTGWSEKQHCADRAVTRIHASEKYLVESAHAPHGPLLPHDSGREPLFEFLGAGTFLVRV